MATSETDVLERARAIASAVGAAGGRALIVGGWVRDHLMGVEDIADAGHFLFAEIDEDGFEWVHVLLPHPQRGHRASLKRSMWIGKDKYRQGDKETKKEEG